MNISLRDIINEVKLEEVRREPVEVIDNKFQIENEEYKIILKKDYCNRNEYITFKFVRLVDNKEVYTYYKSKYPAVVMNTIKQELNKLLYKNNIIIFTANNEEPRRVKLYKREVIKLCKMNPQYDFIEINEGSNTLFIIYNTNINLDDYKCEELSYLQESK